MHGFRESCIVATDFLKARALMRFAALYRTSSWLPFTGFITCGVCFAALVVLDFTGQRAMYRQLFRVMVWCIMPGMFLAFFIGYVCFQKVKDLVRQMNFLSCYRCYYDLSKQSRLSDDPDAVRCPECGELWGVEALQEKWKKRVGMGVQYPEE